MFIPDLEQKAKGGAYLEHGVDGFLCEGDNIMNLSIINKSKLFFCDNFTENRFQPLSDNLCYYFVDQIAASYWFEIFE